MTTSTQVVSATKALLDHQGLQRLFDELASRGHKIIAPTVRESAIVFDYITSIDELPVGWTDEQEPGKYRLARRNDRALFGYAVGPHSWKKFLFPPSLRLWQAQRTDDGFEIIEDKAEPQKLAFIGVRACELKAIAIQDKVFLHGEYSESHYQVRRDHAFLVAVNCGQAGGTCFCVSMNAGPKADSGYDIALTEILEEGRHAFLAESGSPAGEDILRKLDADTARAEDFAAAGRACDRAKAQMGRTMDTTDIKDLLYRNRENPRWDEVAERCLTCGNCTMVCPTCFCHTVEDVTDLTGQTAERHRHWDSCFTTGFSYIHGGNVRSSVPARYRQWLTHKLASWIDQFGTSGCVGCGRCITWCPTGIDITEEVRAIRETDRTVKEPGND